MKRSRTEYETDEVSVVGVGDIKMIGTDVWRYCISTLLSYDDLKALHDSCSYLFKTLRPVMRTRAKAYCEQNGLLHLTVDDETLFTAMNYIGRTKVQAANLISKDISGKLWNLLKKRNDRAYFFSYGSKLYLMNQTTTERLIPLRMNSAQFFYGLNHIDAGPGKGKFYLVEHVIRKMFLLRGKDGKLLYPSVKRLFYRKNKAIRKEKEWLIQYHEKQRLEQLGENQLRPKQKLFSF